MCSTCRKVKKVLEFFDSLEISQGHHETIVFSCVIDRRLKNFYYFRNCATFDALKSKDNALGLYYDISFVCPIKHNYTDMSHRDSASATIAAPKRRRKKGGRQNFIEPRAVYRGNEAARKKKVCHHCNDDIKSENKSRKHSG